MEHYLILALIVSALLLFGFEVVRPDVVALGVAIILMLSGAVSIEEGFSGFSNPAVITVIAMFILSSGLVRTGIADYMSIMLLKVGGNSPALMTVAVMLTVGVMSAFMNNIGATAILISAIFAVARKSGYPAAKLLIPLSFGSLLGGITTLIGTPPNLLVTGILEQQGYAGFRMFDFAPTGLVVMGVAILYMVFIGRHLLPSRDGPQDFTSEYQLEGYITEVIVSKKSPLIGKSLASSKLQDDYGLTVIEILRHEEEQKKLLMPHPDIVLEEEDRLLVEGNLTKLMEAGESGPLEIRARRKFTQEKLEKEGIEIAEVAVAPNAAILGRSIKFSDIRRRFGVLVLALRRRETALQEDYTSVPLEVGDVMLLQGTPSALVKLAQSRDFLVVNRLEHAPRRLGKAPVALSIMALTVLSAATGFLHISLAAFIGVLLMSLTGCVKPQEMYRDVEWRVVFLIAFMMPLGLAMDSDHVGTADWIAGLLLYTTQDYGPYIVLASLIIVTTMVTEVMSNAAAAVLVAPIGIAIAVGLGLEPHTFMMAIAIAASTTFLTPIGHQANVLVYGVGGYKFLDFTKVGFLLNIIILITTLIIVPIVWPFTPLQ